MNADVNHRQWSILCSAISLLTPVAVLDTVLISGVQMFDYVRAQLLETPINVSQY